MTPKALTAIAVVIAVLAAIALLKHYRVGTTLRQEITFAVASQPISAPVYVAYERGFFDDEGLPVSLQSYHTGKEALEAVIRGRHHFCTVADTPLVFAGLQGEKIAIIATIGEAMNYVKVMARKDRGIAGPEDLSGKKIGVSRGTSAEYFLHAYLIFNRIAKDSVQIVDVALDRMADALANGEIDAAVAWNPYLTAQQQRLGDKAIVLTNDYIYALTWNIAARQAFARQHPDTVESLLRALVKASDYIVSHPEQARAIVARRLDDETVTLTGYSFDVHLRQNLLIDLESQARWAIMNRLTDQDRVPNFLPLLYIDGLMAVDPEAVTVIR